MQVARIAELVGGVWEGDGTREIRAAAPLESAQTDEIAFVGNRKAAIGATNSRAGCLIVTAEFPSGRTLIRVAEPRAAFARAIAHLYPKRRAKPEIHPSVTIAEDVLIGESVSIGPFACLGAGSRIGARTVIGPGCVIGANVGIGEDCLLHAGVTCYDDVSIGARVILHSGCVLGADGFGFVLSGDHNVFSDPAVVTDMDHVVQLGTLSDLRHAQGRAVDA